MDKEKGKLENRLRDFGQEPNPEIWGNLETQLAKKRKPRAPFWWFLAAGLFLPIMAGIWFWNSGDVKPETSPGVGQVEKGEPNFQKERSAIADSKSTENQSGKIVNQQTENQVKSQGFENSSSKLGAGEKENDLENLKQTSNSISSKNATPQTEDKATIALLPTEKSQEKVRKSSSEEEGNQVVSTNKKKRKGRAFGISNLSLPPTLAKGTEVKNAENQKLATEEKGQSGNSKALPDPLVSEKSGNENKEISTIETSKVKNENQIPESDSKNVVDNKSVTKPEIKPIVAESNIVSETESNKMALAVKKSDSTLVVQNIDSSATNAAVMDTTKKEKKSGKSAWFVFAGVKASVTRTIAINQTTGESRIILDEQASSFSSRLGYDAGIRYEKFFNSWLGLNGNLGLSILQDEIYFNNAGKADGYELIAQNGEIRYLPKISNTREKIHAQLAFGFGSFGLSLRPISWLPVFRINGGIQSSFFSSISKETIGISGTLQSEKWKIQKPIYSFQISAAQPIRLRKGEIWIEPFYQYYTGNVFEFRPGNYSMPGQLGMHIAWKW
jgi:hypothetical protein